MNGLLHFLLHFWWTQFFVFGFFGIGRGPNSGERNESGKTGALGDFSTSLGEKDLSKASNFWDSILSGDPSKIATVLGPQISGINKRAQESKKTTSEFHNRGGGTNASMQMTDDNTRTSVDSLISGLTGQAAGELGAIGSSALGTGLSAHEATFDMEKTLHDQHAAKMNDLFKSIMETAAAPFTGGASLALGEMKMPGGSGGGGGGPANFSGFEYKGPTIWN